MIYWTCSLLFLCFLSCTVRPSETGTYNSSLDAEVREIKFHDTQLVLLEAEIDSLKGINPRNSDQEARLTKASERKTWHEGQREEAIRRANQKGQDWNLLYQNEAKHKDEGYNRRTPPH